MYPMETVAVMQKFSVMTRYAHLTINRRVRRYQREVIRIRKSKDRQHNGEKKKDERTNNDLQNIT